VLPRNKAQSLQIGGTVIYCCGEDLAKNVQVSPPKPGLERQ